MNVFLDDQRACPEGFVLARSSEECGLLLQECEIDVLSLDYDLGWDQPTGMDVVRLMISTHRYPREIYLHSSSFVGRKNMYELLYQSKPESVKLANGPIPYEKLLHIAKTRQE
ncbi:cyclic-phosphate processing receiver domain-containing protein [Paenibacillus sp. UNC451MF]|uniref:cyclic-phosphate processing receiver domain-containing protein n=1 Tax=Paenibacillus sp. UNC451MF TaxID=1449063 RepID=UPI002F35C371